MKKTFQSILTSLRAILNGESQPSKESKENKPQTYSDNKDTKPEPIIKNLVEFCLEKMIKFTCDPDEVKSKHKVHNGLFYDMYKWPLENPEFIIIKILKKGEKKWEGTTLEHEAKMVYLAQQLSDGIVNLKHVYESELRYALVFEYITFASLESQIKPEDLLKKIPWSTRLFITLEVGKILEKLHSHPRKIIHRQIRSHHILFDEKTKQVKLIDFSHALFENDHEILQFFRGTVFSGNKICCWISPEEVGDDVSQLTTATDIYGMGNLLFELSTGSHPFSELKQHQIPPLKTEGAISKIPNEKCPLAVRELIQLCWSFKPEDRPCISELMKLLRMLIFFLSKKGVSREKEFDALNFSLNSLKQKYDSECKLSFFMGFHPRVGKDSPIYSLSKNHLYDEQVTRLILEFN
jgi:serine/threonine protein kinase